MSLHSGKLLWLLQFYDLLFGMGARGERFVRGAPCAAKLTHLRLARSSRLGVSLFLVAFILVGLRLVRFLSLVTLFSHLCPLSMI